MGVSGFIPRFLDSYDRQARLYPGLLAFLPAAVLFVCLYGADNIAGSSVLSILGLCGAAYALSRVARDAGKRIQDRLFEKWGGAPTTQLLRHSNAVLDRHTKERFHRIIAAGIGKNLPSAEDERSDPRAADELYRAATIWLINQTRDAKAHPLVLKENTAFGFHRNALGIRAIGVLVAILCTVWTLFNGRVLMIGAPHMSLDALLTLDSRHLVALSIALVMLVVWTFWITESAACRAAFAYAERLLQSCDHLHSGGRVSVGGPEWE